MTNEHDRAAKTLLLPFETGVLEPSSGNWLFLNAVPVPALLDLFGADRLTCEQPDRAAFRSLEAKGLKAAPFAAELAQDYDGALVLLGKHRRLNEAWIARASRMVKPGTPIAVSGDKSLGIASARKWAGKRIEIGGSQSKHHAQVFWFSADAAAFSDVDLPVTEPGAGFSAAPGMFSADRVDPGSALLATHVDRRIAGRVADFGAGWGYLSAAILQKAQAASIDMIDTHAPSLQMARQNLMSLAEETGKAASVAVASHWLDLTAEPAPSQYDWIVMNPPFHRARHAEPELGQQFLLAAAKALKPQGCLLMVANRTLPYERVLDATFGRWQPIDDRDGYKIIEAARPKR